MSLEEKIQFFYPYVVIALVILIGAVLLFLQSMSWTAAFFLFGLLMMAVPALYDRFDRISLTRKGLKFVDERGSSSDDQGEGE